MLPGDHERYRIFVVLTDSGTKITRWVIIMGQKMHHKSGHKSILALAVMGIFPSALTVAEEVHPAAVLEEVTVTAQRRTASNQDVAVAVTVATEEDLNLAKVDSVTSLQALSPSIGFTSSNSAANTANILIRGIGTVGNSRSFEGAVGVFIDGVYRTRAGQAMANWLDIESVQILRGPQGTLFGKNTSAGALLISSVAPTLDDSHGDIELTAGNYGKQMVKARYNQVLTDNSALRVAGLWGKDDGFIDDPNGGSYNESAPRALKMQYLINPNDNFSVKLIADWAESKDQNCCYGQVDVDQGPTTAIVDSLTLAQGKKLPSDDFDDYEAVLSNKTDQDLEDEGVSLNLNWTTEGGLKINSITAYREWSSSQMGMDADFGAANILTINETFDTENFSQELTLAGAIDGGFGPVKSSDYIVGVYFADEDIEAEHQLLWGDQAQAFFDAFVAPLPAGFVEASEGLWAYHLMPADSQSAAIFTHWNFDFTDKLSASVGLRYSKDKKSAALEREYFDPSPIAAFRYLGSQPGPTFNEDFNDSAVSGSSAIQYDLADSVMAYASYSRGYKSGGINFDNNAAGNVGDNPEESDCGEPNLIKAAGDCVPNDPSYESEIIDGYEIGLKSEFWGGRGRINAAAFYNDIENLQIATFTGLQFTILNGPDAKSYGAEIESLFLLSESFTLNVDATWLGDASYGKSDDPDLEDFSEQDFARAPEWNANVGLLMNKSISEDWAFIGKASAMYMGDMATSPGSNLRRDAETIYNLNAGVESASIGLGVMLWCQNLTDERYVDQYFPAPMRDDSTKAYVAPPRMYGVTITQKF
jgi:outer membrane receptor protein involved in Fe transport